MELTYKVLSRRNSKKPEKRVVILVEVDLDRTFIGMAALSKNGKWAATWNMVPQEGSCLYEYASMEEAGKKLLRDHLAAKARRNILWDI